MNLRYAQINSYYVSSIDIHVCRVYLFVFNEQGELLNKLNIIID